MRRVGHFGEAVATLGPPAIPSIDASKLVQEIQESDSQQSEDSGSNSSSSSFIPSSTKKSSSNLFLGIALLAAAGFAAYAIWGTKPATPNPLKRGYSRKSISTNIRREIRRGRSPKQAAAIAYSVARKERTRRGLSTAPLKRL